ncbi:unnamed protein product [Arctia plantaginis]|nr:unnamed protein product [Arctia plantaginis]
MACAFDAETRKHKLFANNCTMMSYGRCHNIGYFETEIHFCIKDQMMGTRRMYGESCPVFCPSHYRPVCGASKMRAYNYRAFTNGCQLDMVNCRGDDDDSGYIEVALDFCQRHLMKNIFKTQVIISGFSDYRDYHDN